MIGGYIARTAVRGVLLAAIAALGPACAVALGPVAPAAAAPALVIETPPDGSATNDQTPAISGTTTGSGPVTVNIYRGASAEGTPEQSPSDPLALGGSWSVTPAPLEEGTYTAVAEQADVEELETGASAPVTFTVDTTAPAVTLNALSSPSKDPTPALAGSAGKAEGDSPTVSVTLYEGSSASGKVAAFENVPVSGGSWSYVPPHLGDGTYTAQATQGDAAGNLGTSAARTFTVDTTAPAVTLTTPADGAFLGTSKPTFGGAAGSAPGDAATVTLEVYTGTTASGTPLRAQAAPVTAGAWGVGAAALSDGTYPAVAEQKDEAGNTGTSAPATFTVDTTAPAVSVSPLASPTNDSTPTIKGGAGTAAGDEPSVSLTVYQGSSVGGAIA